LELREGLGSVIVGAIVYGILVGFVVAVIG
jgi:hypothetical protein